MEKIITEVMSLDFPNTSEMSTMFTFPEIQKLLDEGFQVKQLFYTPLTGGCECVNYITITAHLQKIEK